MTSPNHPAKQSRLGFLVMFGAFMVGALALVPATSASAHDYLVASSPARNAVVAAPLAAVSLTFNAPVLDLGGDGSSTLVQVTGPDARVQHFETGCASILDRTVTVPVALGAPGKYTVSWRIVSEDGHPVSDSLDFSYQPTGDPTESPGQAGPQKCGSDTAGDQTAAVPTAAPTDTVGEQTQNLQLIVAIAIAIGILALAGVITLIATSRRKTPIARPPEPPADE